MAAAAHTLPDERKPSAEFDAARGVVSKAFERVERPPAARQDVLNGQYLIRMGQPLPELNAAFAKAYAAQDDKDPARPLYALVCDPAMPVRGNAVKALLGAAVPHMVALLAAGVTELSVVNARRYVLVFERPQGRSLAVIMAERGKPLTESFISEHVVAPVGAVIHQLGELGFSHGRINPNNIFFGETLIVGECISEPCGYSQPYMFEVPERAQADAAGKGEGMPAQDFYALGALAAYLRLGTQFLHGNPTREAHILRVLRDGSYTVFTHNIDFSDGMTDLLRGTLNDNQPERWAWEEIRLWTKGRRFNMLPPSVPSAGSRPFYIGTEAYGHLRDLAQGLYMHWEATGKLLMDGSLIRWVDLSTGRKDVAEALRKAVLALVSGSGRNVAKEQLDELVTRCLMILDPLAPISLPTVRVHVDGIGLLMADALRTQAPEKLQALGDILDLGLAGIWADLQKRKDEQLPADFSTILWKLDRARMVKRVQGLGFGPERALYDLNPDLSCQSPLLSGNTASSLRELLTSLERVSSSRFRAESPMDTHIGGFIGSKLSLMRPADLTELQSLPKFGKHPAFVTLRLLEQAQESAGRMPLPGLALWVCYHLLEAVDHFHSVSLRQRIFSGIEQLAARGFLQPVVSLLNQRAYAQMDLGGYNEAVVNYFRMSEEIEAYKTRSTLRDRANRAGTAISRQIAGLGLAGTIAFYCWRYFFQ